MTDDTILPFAFPAVQAKKITAAFDGGRLTSNGGVMLQAMPDVICWRTVGLFPGYLRGGLLSFVSHPRPLADKDADDSITAVRSGNQLASRRRATA